MTSNATHMYMARLHCQTKGQYSKNTNLTTSHEGSKSLSDRQSCPASTVTVRSADVNRSMIPQHGLSCGPRAGRMDQHQFCCKSMPRHVRLTKALLVARKTHELTACWSVAVMIERW